MKHQDSLSFGYDLQLCKFLEKAAGDENSGRSALNQPTNQPTKRTETKLNETKNNNYTNVL